MGSNNPGRYRREGRNAFYPGDVAEDSCPYKTTDSWTRQNYRIYWLEGWNEAARSYVPPEPEDPSLLEQLREEFTDEEINALSNVALLEAIERFT